MTAGLAHLNAPQREAVLTTKGPLLVLAGAGTGKTRVVTERIAYLLKEKKVPPDRIVAVTFTNKAANEMKERLAGLLGRNGKATVRKMIIATFHSLCVRILRRDGEKLGYRPHFTISDTSEQIALARRAMRSVHGVGKVKP
ncbi:MAG: UvrD-helicase domain-containing protein, partial [Planctomycetota bacterium]